MSEGNVDWGSSEGFWDNMFGLVRSNCLPVVEAWEGEYWGGAKIVALVYIGEIYGRVFG